MRFSGLLTQTKAQNTLMIGGAGCTLAPCCPERKQGEIVDVNPASFIVARRHFCLPESVICHVDEGEFCRAARPASTTLLSSDRISRRLRSCPLKSRSFLVGAQRLAPGGAVFVKHLVQK